jgi:hypothetical protein
MLGGSILAHSLVCMPPSSLLSINAGYLDACLLVALRTAHMCARIVCLGLGVGVVDVVGLSNRESVARDVYYIYLILPEPLAF